jgi:ATP-dependent DNA helicase RecQ
VHLRAPGSIEAYYQEVGRAGRDGEPATGLLLSGSPDYGFRRRLIDQSQTSDGTPLSAELRERQWQMFLDLMRYVEAGSCRHDFILRYFDDEQEALGGCGHCDVCEQLARGDRSVQAEEERTLVVRKALSGVARLRGRAGLTALAESLHGGDTKRLRQLGLTELSTHGILLAHSPEWVMALLRRLMTAGFVDLTPDQYPVPFLTPKGRQVMRGERRVEVILPPHPRAKASKKASPASVDEGDYDPALYDRLRAVRREIARDKSVAAFVVCHDRTLRDMARLQPQNAFELGQVHGMGPAKVDSYGAHFLAALRRD